MTKAYSIAEARDQLARLVHQAEDGETIELTRRGRPVAVVVSVAHYRRLHGEGRSVWDVVQAFRASHDMEELDIDPDEIFARDETTEREFNW